MRRHLLTLFDTNMLEKNALSSQEAPMSGGDCGVLLLIGFELVLWVFF
jgi:hypothetical protein